MTETLQMSWTGHIKTPMACYSCIYQFKFWYINHLRRVAHTERMLLQT